MKIKISIANDSHFDSFSPNNVPLFLKHILSFPLVTPLNSLSVCKCTPSCFQDRGRLIYTNIKGQMALYFVFISFFSIIIKEGLNISYITSIWLLISTLAQSWHLDFWHVIIMEVRCDSTLEYVVNNQCGEGLGTWIHYSHPYKSTDCVNRNAQ